MKQRGREHTTLTETASLVVGELLKLADHEAIAIKMIAPGIIERGARGRSGQRFVTMVMTDAGFELIVTGQSVQKVAVHLDGNAASATKMSKDIFVALKSVKPLRDFSFKLRERKPRE